MVFEKYKLWQEKATEDKDLTLELENMSDEDISDAFYKDLEFGTAGLRGVIGAGTNRMNIYTVGKATQGLAAYVNSVAENGTVAIAYDSRNNSAEFAKRCAEVLTAHGIKVYLFDELGSIEAAWFFKVNELGPFIVDIDSEGNNYFDQLDEKIDERKKAALEKLGINEDFKFTKLY